MNLSSEIKIVRQKAFLTQTQFAEQLHVSFTTVNRWETGKARPNLSSASICSGNLAEIDSFNCAMITSWSGVLPEKKSVNLPGTD